jgi:hypothetical protein
MTAKLNKIQAIINYSGLSSPPPDDILKRINNTIGDTSTKSIDMIIKKYKEYILSYRITNYETPDKFVKSENKLINLDIFVFGRKYEKNYPMPVIKLTKAMFGDRDFFELHNNYVKINTQLKLKRAKALIKLKEKENVKEHKIKNATQF